MVTPFDPDYSKTISYIDYQIGGLELDEIEERLRREKAYLTYALYENDLIIYLVFASGIERAKILTSEKIRLNGWDKAGRIGARRIPIDKNVNHIWTMHSHEIAFSQETDM